MCQCANVLEDIAKINEIKTNKSRQKRFCGNPKLLVKLFDHR